jgi:hypothetical protein
MDPPLQRVVKLIDTRSVPPEEKGAQVVIDHGEDGAPAQAAGIGVAGAFAAICLADGHRDQLEMSMVAMFGIAQHLIERNAVKAGSQIRNLAPSHVRTSSEIGC